MKFRNRIVGGVLGAALLGIAGQASAIIVLGNGDTVSLGAVLASNDRMVQIDDKLFWFESYTSSHFNPSLITMVGFIAANPNQPRRRFDEDALQALADSVGQLGVLQPVLVRPVAGGRYELVAGERRWRAAGGRRIPKSPYMFPPIRRLTGSTTALRWSPIALCRRG